MCATAIARGAAAPYSGQLLSADLAILLAQGADGCQTRLGAAVARCRDDATIDLEKERAARRADAAAFQSQILETEQQLARARRVAEADAPPFFAQPWFVAPLTALVTAGVVVWALHH